jgi:hypothetical protein
MRYENPLYVAEDVVAVDLGHQQRLAHAGDRWLALSWLSPDRGRDRRLQWGTGTPRCSTTCLRPMLQKPQGLSRLEAAGADFVGVGISGDRGQGGETRHEPASFHAPSTGVIRLPAWA